MQRAALLLAGASAFQAPAARRHKDDAPKRSRREVGTQSDTVRPGPR